MGVISNDEYTTWIASTVVAITVFMNTIYRCIATAKTAIANTANNCLISVKSIHNVDFSCSKQAI